MGMESEKSGARVKRKRFQGLVWEIVVSLAVLMISSLVLIGTVVILMAQYQQEYQTFTPFILILYIILFAIVVSIFGYLVLNRVVLKPLSKLVEATERVAEGDLDFKVDFSEGRQDDVENEITHLADAFNRMTERLKINQAALKEYVRDLEQVNEDLKRTQDQLIFSEKLASVGHLAAGVAHEIGNPLSAILGYLEILERRPELKPEDLDMLRRVKGEVDRIHRIIKDLLDFSRPQEEEREEVDLNRVIKEALRLMEIQKGFKGIQVELDLEDSLPCLHGSLNQVKQLLINLTLNAVDAMHGEGTLTLGTRLIHSADGSGEIEFSVKDTGAGISREDQRRIFDPFYTTKEPGKGSGLGLSICQRIVEGLSGRMELESETGKGTTFFIRIPEARR
jgi:two-component system NtrC family sensor kinase